MLVCILLKKRKKCIVILVRYWEGKKYYYVVEGGGSYYWGKLLCWEFDKFVYFIIIFIVIRYTYVDNGKITGKINYFKIVN